MSMFSPNMNMRPYIGDESGIQLVPEPSRLIGSARSMDECIDISISPWSVASDGCDICDKCASGCGAMFDVECWALYVRRFFPFIGTSFIPHFGQFPGCSLITSGCIRQVYFCVFSCSPATPELAAATEGGCSSSGW